MYFKEKYHSFRDLSLANISAHKWILQDFCHQIVSCVSVQCSIMEQADGPIDEGTKMWHCRTVGLVIGHPVGPMLSGDSGRSSPMMSGGSRRF